MIPYATLTLNSVGYSPGLNKLDGYSVTHTSGGECLQGFRMVVEVQPLLKPTEPQSKILTIIVTSYMILV